MLLSPDSEEQEIATAAADFLAQEMPIERLHAAEAADLSGALRHAFGDMGWFALAVPASDGGAGLSSVELALFFREVGRHCGPMDILAQSLAALLPVDAALRQELMSGQAGVALAVEDGGRIRLMGSAEATYAIQARPGGTRLVKLGDVGTARPALDPAGSMRVLDQLPPDTLAETSDAQPWQLGMLCTAAMLVGIAEASLAMIVDYAKIRETFGRKIGSYQAVRHPCADMALRAEAARCQLWFAAAALKVHRDDAQIQLIAAKHLANQAAVANSDTNIQLHGGIGVTDEHNAHLLLKHAMVLSRLFGGKRVLLGQLLHAKAA